MGRNNYNPSPWQDRFWGKVNKTSACWLWTAHKLHGYGYFTMDDGRDHRAHRLAYELLVGPIPKGLTLDHLCRNKACVNPEHLEPVTMRENTVRATSLKTHCKRGHERKPIQGKPNRRKCRECHVIDQRNYVARLLAASEKSKERAA